MPPKDANEDAFVPSGDKGPTLARLSRTAGFIERNGRPRPSKNQITTWVILVAHAAEPSNHWRAQANAQKLLDAAGIDKELADYHPCIVLGVPAARKYFVDKGYLRVLAPFRPVCVAHGERYPDCSPDCTYGVKLGERWVHELVDSTSFTPAPRNETPTRPNARESRTVPPAPEDADTGGSGFLRSMESDALALAEQVDSADHWAKPYYSSAMTLVPGTSRAFVGLNGAGDRFGHEYDKEDRNDERVWSDPRYNAVLDDRWGDARGARPAGTHSHQRAIQSVFAAMYGDAWSSTLRSTACFNIVPVSSGGQSDPILDSIWTVGTRWGIRLLEYLHPELLILNGNGAARSVWSVLHEGYGIHESTPPLPLENRTFRLREGKIVRGPLVGSRVIGLPHLSRNKASVALRNGLKQRQPFG